MATVIDTVERDGHKIAIYDNGMERDLTIGRLVRPPTQALITPQKANEFKLKRREKQARLLRESIITETHELIKVPRKGSAAAVAAAGGILWREIVLNEDAYPRDRMEAWEKLGRHAEILSSPNETQPPVVVEAATDLLVAVGQLFQALNGAIQAKLHDTVNGEIKE